MRELKIGYELQDLLCSGDRLTATRKSPNLSHFNRDLGDLLNVLVAIWLRNARNDHIAKIRL